MEMYRVPSNNSIIENQLFSKTCRPSSLVSSSIHQSMSNFSTTPKSFNNFTHNFQFNKHLKRSDISNNGHSSELKRKPNQEMLESTEEHKNHPLKNFSQSLYCENIKSFVNLRQTISELDYTHEKIGKYEGERKKINEAFSKKKIKDSGKEIVIKQQLQVGDEQRGLLLADKYSASDFLANQKSIDLKNSDSDFIREKLNNQKESQADSEKLRTKIEFEECNRDSKRNSSSKENLMVEKYERVETNNSFINNSRSYSKEDLSKNVSRNSSFEYNQSQQTNMKNFHISDIIEEVSNSVLESKSSSAIELSLENLNLNLNKEVSQNLIDACTSEMLQMLLQEALKEVTDSN